MVTLSILTSATLSSKIMQNACLKKLFAKYGSELSWKDMQEITAKFPSKQDFDAKGKFTFIIFEILNEQNIC